MGRKKNKKNKKKSSTPSTPQSSTTPSSTPSVEDERQQLIRGGASGSSPAHGSRSTEKKGSGKKASFGQTRNLGATSSRNDPESAYLLENLDVSDEERGAVGPESPSKCDCENKEVHQPECPELKKLQDARNKSPKDKALKNPTGSKISSVPEDGAQSSSSSDPSVKEHFRNAPQSECPEKSLLAVPEQRSGPVSPSKKSPIREGFNKFCKKFTSKRSSGTECNCEDKKAHQPDCLYLKKLEADDRDKSPKVKSSRKSPSKSKRSSGNVSLEKTKDGAQSSSSSDPSVKECFRSDPHSEQTAEKSLLTVPEQASGPVSPSKKSPIREGYEKLRNKISPNRSSRTEDGTRSEVEFQEQKKQTGAKSKLQKNQSKSETSSSSASPITTKKNEDSGTSNVSSKNSKSSSALDPSVKEYFGSDPRSEQSAEKTLLTVPEQGSGPVSPSKKSPIRVGYEKLRKKISPNRSSRIEDGTSSEVDFQEQKKQTGAKDKLQKNQSKSETSSSSASPITTKKNKDSGTSNVSSKNSKSSSSSDPNKSNKTLDCPANKRSNESESSTPSNLTDYDPQEGTSRGPACRSPRKVASKGSGGCKRKSLGGENKLNEFWRKFVRDMGEEVSEDMVPIIKYMDESDSDEKQAQSRPIPRRRSKSFVSDRLGIQLPGTNRRSSPIPFDRNAELNIRIRPIKWHWLEEIKRKAKEKKAKAAFEKEDPAKLLKRNKKDKFERTLLRRIRAIEYDASARRHQSSSPHRLRKCDCKTNSEYAHKIGCLKDIDLRRRRKRRRCRQDV